MKRIAIFASGNGSNAQRIAEYFSQTGKAYVSAIYCNNPNAYVIERAKSLGIPLILFNREQFYINRFVLQDLIDRRIDLLVLAGFLWLLPEEMITTFNNRILNIHPALLPKYGGKGMYGNKVHESVLINNEIESGISIHLVNEKYDEGDIIFQATCAVSSDDTTSTLASRIHELEYRFYPEVIASYLEKLN